MNLASTEWIVLFVP